MLPSYMVPKPFAQRKRRREKQVWGQLALFDAWNGWSPRRAGYPHVNAKRRELLAHRWAEKAVNEHSAGLQSWSPVSSFRPTHFGDTWVSTKVADLRVGLCMSTRIGDARNTESLRLFGPRASGGQSARY